MFKMWAVLGFAVVGLFASALNSLQPVGFTSDSITTEIVLTEYERVDTFACPQRQQMESNLLYGLSDDTATCSLVIWSDVESSQSLGMYQVHYFDATETTDLAELEGFEVELFRIKIQGVVLYAIRDMLDEHVFDIQPIGLQGGVAYELWEDHPGLI